MEKLRMALIALIVTVTMNAQDLKTSEVPASFTEGLLKKYPTATNIEWKKNNTDYKVEFEVGRMEYEIWFNKDGGTLLVEKEITRSLMPKGLIDIINKDYADYRIDAVEAIEKNGQTTYKVELEKSWDQQLIITYTKAGKVLNISKD
ncbi:PepSY-like domain-containing protein [Flavobacteriaceae bacterium F89]|uniref:PepSY-like domain-containing protein n=1 Tax=Cerina litoralis TaxID=2874477 RepID=A0AAE3JPV1_9FLAO|nr:PepSY-like domain-containing protein [Cerina litoralis]MCG2461174.1 PepSY-like domain-containing protein [Cerina litoralis]